MEFLILTIERLTLRRVFPKNIDAVFEGLSNGDVTQFMAVHYSTLQEAEIQMND